MIEPKIIARILEIIITFIAIFLISSTLLIIKPIREPVEKFVFYIQ